MVTDDCSTFVVVVVVVIVLTMTHGHNLARGRKTQVVVADCIYLCSRK